MMQDTLDETLDNGEEFEAEAQEEIDKVIFEVTAGTYTDSVSNSNNNNRLS